MYDLTTLAQYIHHIPPHSTDICIIGNESSHVLTLFSAILTDKIFFNFSNPGLFTSGSCKVYDIIILLPDMVACLEDDKSFVARCADSIRDNGLMILKPTSSVINVTTLNNANIAGLILLGYDSNGIFLFRKNKHLPQLNPDIAKEFKYNTLYVICPASIKSGGPELLHQLVYIINLQGGNAYIAYVNKSSDSPDCNYEYQPYVAGHIADFDAIKDIPDNAVVVPEGWVHELGEFDNLKKYLWWLSVDNFSFYKSTNMHQIITYIDNMVINHLYQSYYALDFILKNGIAKKKALYLSDYINDIYIENASLALNEPKEDRILYNPRKGGEVTELLINAAPELDWTPIINMSANEVSHLMRHSKIYIDFGHHPGKDRIPREAAMSGCIIITGMRGSAAFSEDVNIPPKYKINDKEMNINAVISLIKDSILKYNDIIDDFKEYRSIIRTEKEKFINDIADIFFNESP